MGFSRAAVAAVLATSALLTACADSDAAALRSPLSGAAGKHWLLLSVSRGVHTVDLRGRLRLDLMLFPDGRMVGDDGHAFNSTYRLVPSGMSVRFLAEGADGYAGSLPEWQATAFNAMSALSGGQYAHGITVTGSKDGPRLRLSVDGWRLLFRDIGQLAPEAAPSATSTSD